jgi:4a-hydroxytetrahydrobiopterin dehydratase
MERVLSRPEASEAVEDIGWRFLLGTLRTSVAVGSLARAIGLAADAVAVCGDDADGHLRVDARPDRVVFTLQSLENAAVTTRDVDLAHRISATEDKSGFLTEPDIGAGAPRSVQMVEIAIDALDIAGIRPFWKAVLGYADEAGAEGPEDPLIDPVGQGPAIWFQQMDRPRPQRNRIHFDICVPHDEAQRRVEAALAAGGRLVSAKRAPAFWVLADLEGNEACVTTWQGRDAETRPADAQ